MVTCMGMDNLRTLLSLHTSWGNLVSAGYLYNASNDGIICGTSFS